MTSYADIILCFVLKWVIIAKLLKITRMFERETKENKEFYYLQKEVMIFEQ